MTTQELIELVEKMDYPQQLDTDYEGSCPCFWYTPIVDGHKLQIHGHCWRTCNECLYNGIHVSGCLTEKDLRKIAKAFKKQLDKQEWYSKYEIVINSTKKCNANSPVSKK